MSGIQHSCTTRSPTAGADDEAVTGALRPSVLRELPGALHETVRDPGRSTRSTCAPSTGARPGRQRAPQRPWAA